MSSAISMREIDENAFVEQLIAKLRGDTKQSNFMRCYAEDKSSTKFDLTNLKHWPDIESSHETLDGSLVKVDLATHVMRGLLSTSEFNLKISAKPSSAKSASAQQAVRQLEGLLQRTKEERKDYGVDLLRLGFPQIECFDEKTGRTYLCPLVLWKVRLDSVNGRTMISRDFSDPAEINDALYQFLLTEAELDLKQGRRYADKDMFNDVDVENIILSLLPAARKNIFSGREDISEALRRVMDPLDRKFPQELPAAPKTTKANTHSSTSSSGSTRVVCRVVWAAVLALFKTGNNTILKDLRAYQKQRKLSIGTGPVISGARGSFNILHGGLALDPSQFEAIRQLAENRNLVINGPPGTGKSQTLASVISCAGANNLKVLVVCEKKTPLEILQRKLAELSWNGWTGDKFTALITNVQDREALVQRARENRVDVDAIPLEQYDREENKILKDIRRLETDIANEEHKFTQHCEVNNRLVSFNMTVQEAIAFIIQRKLNGATVLTPPEGAQFIGRVFAQDHLMRIDRCQKNLPREFLQALSLLNFTRFKSDYFNPDNIQSQMETLLSDIKHKLDERDLIIEKAKHEFIEELNQKLATWENFAEELQAIGVCLKDIPNEDIQRSDTPSWFDRISSLFFTPVQTRLRYFRMALKRIEDSIKHEVAKAASNDDENGSARKKRGNPIADAQLPTNFTLSNIDRIVKWSKKMHEKTAVYLLEVTSKSSSEAWKEFYEVRAKGFMEYKEVNEKMKDAIIQSPFSTKPAIRAFDPCLELTNNNDAYWSIEKILKPYNSENTGRWRQCAESIQTLLDFGLVQNESFFTDFLEAGKLDTLTWGDRVKLCVLVKEVEPTCRELITSDFVLDHLSDALTQIQRMVQMLFCIRQAKAMANSIKIFESHGRQRFEQFFNRKAKNIQVNSLRELVGDAALFCGCFPILFCTPEVASTLFKGKAQLFDLVIFDEASQSLTHDAYASLLKGRKVIIAGDNKQMPPTTLFSGAGDGMPDVPDSDPIDDDFLFHDFDGEERNPRIPASSASKTQALRSRRNAANAESLLDYAKDHSFSFRSVDLCFHYRSLNPDLMRFHCAAIYPTLALCPERPASSSDDPAIKLKQVSGKYKDQQNVTEAEEITELLRRIVAKQVINSSIAVATFNEAQKKQILKVIKHHPDRVFLQQLRTLQNKQQFFVKNLENLQGDEVDTLIVGTTFGPNARGVFEKRFGRIAFAGVGYRYLNVLFSRAKEKVHIVTSIPEVEYLSPERELDEGGMLSGKSMLFGYLSYAHAVSNGDEKRVRTVLREFSVDETISANKLSSANASLEAVIYNALVRKDHFRSTKIDRVTDANTLLQGILVRLGNQRTLVIQCNSFDNYRQSIYRKSLLERLGYEFFQVWPANWLENPEREFHRLKDVISDVRKRPKLESTAMVDSQSMVNPESSNPPGQALRQSSQSPSTLILDKSDDSIVPTTRTSHTQEPPFIVDMVSSSSVPSSNLEQSGNNSSKASSSDASSEIASIQSEIEVEVKLGSPYLVKYGNKRKYVVFVPDKFVRGSEDFLLGTTGDKSKSIKVARRRLMPFGKRTPPLESFLDHIEHDRAVFFGEKFSQNSKSIKGVDNHSDSDEDFIDAESDFQPEDSDEEFDVEDRVTTTRAASKRRTPQRSSNAPTLISKKRRKSA